MKNKTKKIMAMICLVLILLTSLPIQTFATFITDMNSNAKFGVISGSLANYGHELHYANYDGQTYLVFCTQYGISSPDGSEYTYNGDFIVQYKNNLPQYEKIAEMIYFGYTMNYGTGIPSSTEAIRAMCCTQQYVWESLGVNPGRDTWNGNYMSSGYYSNWLAQTEAYYNQYHGNVSFNGTTSKISLGQNTAITDTSGKLSSYQTFTQNVNGIIFHHDQGSNELNIIVPSDCTSDSITFNSASYGIYQLMPNGASYDKNTMSNYIYIQFSSGAVQNLMFSNYVDPSAFSVSVQVEYGNTLLIKTNTNGDTLAGCTFGLYKDKNCTEQVRTGTSDSNGQIYFQRLAPATYFIKELSVPTGYLLDTTIKEVTIKANETAEVSFKNDEPTGELKLIKTDKETGNQNRVDGTSHHGDATIEGTEYTLYASEDIYNVAKTIKYFSKNEEIATFNFNSNGVAKINISTSCKTANLTTDGDTLKGLPLGTYYAKETRVPEGYNKDTETHTLTLKYKDMNTKIINLEDSFTNKVEKAKFEVIKVSSNTNATADILEGAEFTAILTKYVDFYGSFDEALKHLAEYAEDEYSVFKTEANGHGISGLLAYGKYTVEETYCPSIWVNPVEPFTAVIDKDSAGVIKEYIENDTPFESYIKMVKKDVKTGKVVTLSNATFSLYKLDENTNDWEKVSCKLGRESFDRWTTDSEGIAYTETKLEAGTYKLTEIEIPTGFLQLDEDIIFEVNRGNDTVYYDEDYDAYIIVEVKNEQPTGTLKVNKKLELRDDVDYSLIKDIDFTEISFELKASEDIIDMADGSVIYAKDEVVGTYNLNSDGTLEVTDLPMGSYEFYEVTTIKGAVLDETIYDVVFEQKDTTKKVYTVELDIENYTTITEFSKTDITGEDELEGAKLIVLDENNEIVIDSWISGTETHKIEGLEVGKVYMLIEEITPNGYVQATPIRFEIKNTGEIQKVTMIDKVVEISKEDISGNEIEGAKLQVIDTDGNVIDEWISSKEAHKVNGLEENKTYKLHEEVSVENYVKATDIEFKVTTDKETQKITMIDKLVEVTKTDLTNGEELEGAELQVVDEDGNVIDEWTSTKEPHKVTGLEEGKTYILTEITCPYGYEQAESITFTVTEDKETQKVEMKDMPILKNIKVIKIDIDTKEVIKDKFTFGIYEDEECTKLIKEIKSNKEDGFVTFEDLRYGTYYIKETKAPTGYELSNKIVKVDMNDKGIFVDDVQVEENDNMVEFTFENKKIEVPKTGDESNIMFIGGIALLSILGIAYIIIHNNNKKKEQ